MKLPFTIHLILVIVAIGVAVGANSENLRPLIAYPLTGLAIGLGITFAFRILSAL
jgi:hypothetical protein